MKNRKAKITIKKDRLSLLGIYFLGIISIYFALAIGLWRADYGLGTLPPFVFYIGVAMALGGEALRQWSTYALGRFFTGPVVVFSDHRVIKRGPYKWVRHPGYLGGLISNAGLGLCVQSWIAMLVCLGLMALAYTYRISLEEKALHQKFGKEYDSYAKKTPMILPGIR